MLSIINYQLSTMKALNNTNPLMILFGLLLFLIFQSCEKKLNGGTACLAYMVADTLRFNIIDRTVIRIYSFQTIRLILLRI